MRAAPDGYTLLLTASADAYLASLYPDLRFDHFRDMSQVAGIALTPNVMEVNPVFPAKTVAEFINYAKANPGKINYASGGVGTGPHLCGELFKMMTGIDMLHLPYRGTAPAISDLIGGRVQVMFDFLPSSIEYVRAGRLRALAVTTAARNEFLPDVPTVADFVSGFEASLWLGVGAPRNTPAAVIDKLNREINSALADARQMGGKRTAIGALMGIAIAAIASLARNAARSRSSSPTLQERLCRSGAPSALFRAI